MPETSAEGRWKRLPTLERVPRMWGDAGPLVRLLAAHDAQRTPTLRRVGSLTAKQFVQYVQQSGLVEDTVVVPRLKSWAAELAESGGLENATGFELAERMVAARILSVWQAEKLLAGKHKGFELANYRIVDLLAISPLAAVYRAEHQLMRRAVAMAVLSDRVADQPSAREQFFRRARGVAELDHPNLVHVFDVGEERTMCYSVMEYVSGYDLQRLVRRLGPLPQDLCAGIVRQVGLGLQSVHASGQSLGGMRPGDAVLDPNGVAHVLTLRLDVALADCEVDRLKSTRLSPHDDPYLPDRPNQSFSARQRDIYSVGVLLYFLLTGQPPPNSGKMEMADSPQLGSALLHDRPATDPELVDIVEHLTSCPAEEKQVIQQGVKRLTDWLAATGA